ncbi:Kidney mitochondrial carrier protein 1 [Phytophthora nicotianae]|uniref:Kidney mitochondrial carrier protein 1 n=1 Tax=Phytophthora nicotianae TaxID=4792 RepID=A0A0W8DKB9_PHYNI|nr:Kidney mitochondrial carrier protein 1 [Phytophthora nicotianae]
MHGQEGLKAALDATELLFGKKQGPLTAEEMLQMAGDAPMTILSRTDVVDQSLVDLAVRIGAVKSKVMGDANGEAPLGIWAQRKEARRNMYATSTDQVRVHRRGLGSSSSSSAAAMCQKCLRPGHWTYECKNEAVYVQRPSRSQQLRNPKLRQPFNKDKPPELLDKEHQKAEKGKKLKLKLKDKAKAKKKSKTSSRCERRRSVSSSGSSSGSDSSSLDSSSSDSDSSDSDSSSDSSSSSSGSDSDSSGSDSDGSASSSNSDRSSRRRHRSKRRRRD